MIKVNCIFVQIAGSKICGHLDCLQALDMYEYTPCKRSDVVLGINLGKYAI